MADRREVSLDPEERLDVWTNRVNDVYGGGWMMPWPLPKAVVAHHC